jgi:hypothetical protein
VTGRGPLQRLPAIGRSRPAETGNNDDLPSFIGGQLPFLHRLRKDHPMKLTLPLYVAFAATLGFTGPALAQANGEGGISGAGGGVTGGSVVGGAPGLNNPGIDSPGSLRTNPGGSPSGSLLTPGGPTLTPDATATPAPATTGSGVPEIGNPTNSTIGAPTGAKPPN